jgi:hypothetical protein
MQFNEPINLCNPFADKLLIFLSGTTMYDLPERKRGSKYVVNEDIVTGKQTFYAQMDIQKDSALLI